MTISIYDLKRAANRATQRNRQEQIKILQELPSENKAFLCHSHKDKDLALGLQILLLENECYLYIDWQDNDMPETPDKTTALKIKKRIADFGWFLFLATPNSTTSQWCPWEIGIADTRKENNKILVIPTTDHSGKWYGNEYLQLYDRIVIPSNGGLAKFKSGSDNNGIYVKEMLS